MLQGGNSLTKSKSDLDKDQYNTLNREIAIRVGLHINKKMGVTKRKSKGIPRYSKSIPQKTCF